MKHIRILFTVFSLVFAIGVGVFGTAGRAMAAKCADSCTAGKTCTCIDGGKTCSGSPISGTFSDCDGTSGYVCCASDSSSGSCNASYCKTSACDTSKEKPENTDCTTKVCKSGEHYCEPNSSSGGGSGSSVTASISLPNPLKYNTVQQVVTALLYALQGVIVALSLVFIVIGAVLYITSAGNQGRVTMAKTAITAALIGLSIGILAPTFLKEIATVLGWGGTLPSEVSGAKSASDILLSVLNFLLGLVGILAIIMLVIGGGMFLGSAGDMNRIGVAKKIVNYSLIGLIVALASLVVVRQLAEFFAPATS